MYAWLLDNPQHQNGMGSTLTTGDPSLTQKAGSSQIGSTIHLDRFNRFYFTSKRTSIRHWESFPGWGCTIYTQTWEQNHRWNTLSRRRKRTPIHQAPHCLPRTRKCANSKDCKTRREVCILLFLLQRLGQANTHSHTIVS